MQRNEHLTEPSILFENLQFDNNYSINVSQQKAPTSFPLHWHTFGELVLALEDDVVLTVQTRRYTLKKNDILFIWPGELHDTVSTPGPGSHLIIQFTNALLTGNADVSMMQSYILNKHRLSYEAAPDYASQIAGHMLQVRDMFARQLPLNNLRMSLSIQHIFLALFDYCMESSAAEQPETRFSRLHSIQAVTNACCYIAENCEKNLSLDTVAEYVGLSKFHFSRIFKEHTKSNFCDYLAMQRIQKAILLFEDPEISIAEAAFQSGFGSIASFNRCFKKYKNCTPSDYRTLLRQE